MGITYQDAISMPIDIAIALLSSDERPKQTHQAPTPTPSSTIASKHLSSNNKRYIASRRKSQS